MCARHTLCILHFLHIRTHTLCIIQDYVKCVRQIVFLESPEPDTQGFWRKQSSTTRDSVYLREIGDLRGSEFIMWICLRRGSEFYMWIYVLDPEPSQSLTSIHRHFPPPTSLRPRHFYSHSHFSSLFLVLETQNLPYWSGLKTPPNVLDESLNP